VTDADSAGLAAENGIQPGDLITSVNRREVNSVDDFDKAMSDFGQTKSVLFRVKNRQGTRFVVVGAK